MYKHFKRSYDICAALAGLILFSPVLIVAAILIKLTSRGNIFYVSPRVGQYSVKPWNDKIQNYVRAV